MRAPQKVRVDEPTKRGKSWVCRWRVDGRGTSTSHPTKAQADRYRRALLDAADRGEPFDVVTLKPETWTRGVTVADFALEWLPKAWRSWEPKGRAGVLEGTTAAVLALTDRPVPQELRSTLRAWLREALTPGDAPLTPEARYARDWLRAHSLQLGAIDGRAVRAALETMALRDDGKPASANYLSKRRTGMTRLLGAAVDADLIKANPSAGVRTPTRSKPGVRAIPTTEIPTVAEAQLLLMAVATVSKASRRLVAYLATTLYAGLRPGEANGLRAHDLELPETGWGVAHVTSSRTAPGARYTDDGETTSEGAIKARNPGEVREVPLHPDLVCLLRTHMALWPPGDDGLVFTTAGGGLLNSNIDRTIDRAVKRLGWDKHPHLAGVHHYSLRHTCASTLLEVLPDTVVAERLGHSLEVLHGTYAHVVRRSVDELNARAEGAFR